MRRLLLLFILNFYNPPVNNSQIFNRSYITLGGGYQRHKEMSLTGHFFNYFSTNVYLGESNLYVGPVYYPSVTLFSNSKGQRLQNNYTYQGILIGLTTRTMKFYDFSGMIGYSKIKATEYHNIKKHEHANNNTEFVTYDIIKRKDNSLTFRIDFILRANEAIGFNFSYVKNYNSIRNEFNFMAGLSIGIVEDFKSENWKWNKKKQL